MSYPDQKNLFIVDYKRQWKGLRFYPTFIRRWQNRVFLRKLEKIIKHKINVIWNFENFRFFDLNFARGCFSIYHQVDLNQDFHPRVAARTADICFCTTDYIKSQLQPYTDKVFKIHHAVSKNAFADADRLINENRKGQKVPATYVGNLDILYLDNDLLRKDLVEKFQNVEFILVGAYKSEGKTFVQLSSFPNVKFVGKVPSERIKDFLSESDILLLCYRPDSYREQLARPHKMMEYLASGKVVVATYTDEYKDEKSFVIMRTRISRFFCNFLMMWSRILISIILHL